MEELMQRWLARDALYAAAREPLTEGQADVVRRWRRLEAGEIEVARRKAAYMAASRWMPPALGAW